MCINDMKFSLRKSGVFYAKNLEKYLISVIPARPSVPFRENEMNFLFQNSVNVF